MAGAEGIEPYSRKGALGLANQSQDHLTSYAHCLIQTVSLSLREAYELEESLASVPLQRRPQLLLLPQLVRQPPAALQTHEEPL